MAKVSQIIGERVFPERRLLLESSTGLHHVSLPGWLQAMFLAASLATIGAVAYLCVGFMHLRDTLDSRTVEAKPAVSASAQPTSAPTVASAPASTDNAAALAELHKELTTLQQQVASLNQSYAQANTNYQQANDKVSALTQQNGQLQAQLTDATTRAKSAQDARDEAERRAKTNEQALSSKTGSAEQLVKTLDASKNELQQSEVERTTLQNRVQQLQMDLQTAQNRADMLEARNQQLQQQQLAADPQHISPAPFTNAPSSSSPALVPPVSPEATPPERKPTPSAGPHAENNVSGASTTSSELERLLASTGVNIDRMLQGLGNTSGEGGPYIALNDPRAAGLDQKRLQDLQRLAKLLPLAAPLNQFTMSSGFGPRIDPINHRASFHPGLDLDAPYLTTVYSTAPGSVIFTGTMDGYGKVVDIDHGHGIVTRYAHLHRILVAKGQKVALHTPIGELGSTGRSTGPHLHYEVHVDGVAVDPAKFMQAGKDVVQVSGQR